MTVECRLIVREEASDEKFNDPSIISSDNTYVILRIPSTGFRSSSLHIFIKKNDQYKPVPIECDLLMEIPVGTYILGENNVTIKTQQNADNLNTSHITTTMTEWLELHIPFLIKSCQQFVCGGKQFFIREHSLRHPLYAPRTISSASASSSTSGVTVMGFFSNTKAMPEASLDYSDLFYGEEEAIKKYFGEKLITSIKGLHAFLNMHYFAGTHNLKQKVSIPGMSALVGLTSALRDHLQLLENPQEEKMDQDQDQNETNAHAQWVVGQVELLQQAARLSMKQEFIKFSSQIIGAIVGVWPWAYWGLMHGAASGFALGGGIGAVPLATIGLFGGCIIGGAVGLWGGSKLGKSLIGYSLDPTIPVLDEFSSRVPSIRKEIYSKIPPESDNSCTSSLFSCCFAK